MSAIIPFGLSAWIFILVYLASLLVIGWIGYKARTENTLADYYLGSGFGLVVLFLTLYATQYSGNTFFGYTGKTYRIGYAWVMCIQFMTAIIVCYMLFAPRLYQLAKQHQFVTPVDYLQYRFQSKWLNLIAIVIMSAVLANYFLAQLMAMGRAMQGLSGTDPFLSYVSGVILLTVIMLIYGTLGGMRAIAWTDVIQGVVLMVGFFILIVMLYHQFGSLEDATRIIIQSEDTSIRAKAALPDAHRLREWLSYILIVGLAGSLYPQAIQRIYAAKSATRLRQSLALMAFVPLTTTLIAVITGIYAIAYLPGQSGAASDQIFASLLFEVQNNSFIGYWLVVILFSAALAAMMSTADSALLSLSSMMGKDLYGGFFRPDASEAELTRVSKRFSFLMVFLLIGLAILLYDKASLIRLLDRKFDLLVQLVPAFILSIHLTWLQARAVVIGLLAGVIISLLIAFGGFEAVQQGKLFGFHPGLYGLIVNVFLGLSLSINSR